MDAADRRVRPCRGERLDADGTHRGGGLHLQRPGRHGREHRRSHARRDPDPAGRHRRDVRGLDGLGRAPGEHPERGLQRDRPGPRSRQLPGLRRRRVAGGHADLRLWRAGRARPHGHHLRRYGRGRRLRHRRGPRGREGADPHAGRRDHRDGHQCGWRLRDRGPLREPRRAGRGDVPRAGRRADRRVRHRRRAERGARRDARHVRRPRWARHGRSRHR